MRRRLGRRTFVRGAALGSVGLGAWWLTGCSGGSSEKPAPTASAGASPSPADITPVLLTGEFVAGEQNRFAVGLLQGNKVVRGGQVHLRFFTIGADGVTGTFRGEADASAAELTVPGAHDHDTTPGDAGFDDTVSFYEVQAPFDTPGKWGVEITAPATATTTGKQIQTTFQVLEKSPTPAAGAPAPASHNDTAATNPNLASLCSRVPACPLHDAVIADVLGRRPLVVQFSTPAFCQTRFCGPVLEALLTQVPAYQDRITFVHIEVWQDFQSKTYRPAMREWNLSSEPWTFFVARDGTVASKLEAVFTIDELRARLDAIA